MKTLTVNLREARRANDVISNIRYLNNILEPTCSNEWLLQTEDADEEDALIETIHFYFNTIYYVIYMKKIHEQKK